MFLGIILIKLVDMERFSPVWATPFPRQGDSVTVGKLNWEQQAHTKSSLLLSVDAMGVVGLMDVMGDVMSVMVWLMSVMGDIDGCDWWLWLMSVMGEIDGCDWWLWLMSVMGVIDGCDGWDWWLWWKW